MTRSGTPTLPIVEKRAGKRVDTLVPVTAIVGGRRYAFKIQNVSMTGARLQGPLTLSLGQHIDLVLELEGLPPAAVVAEVVRVHTADLMTDTAAVRFINLSPAVQAAIAAHMKRLGVDDDDDERITGQLPIMTEADVEADVTTTPLDRVKKS